ncbi:MAG TPA: hypothetical protein DCP91_12765 [Eggerthellaceae bacterium]|nr:hypothetical protein [Eggerthellaceae bacterium]
MQIGVTNPLREFLRWKPFPPNHEEQPLFCWDAHRVKVDGRIMLVVCNAANRFAGVTAMRAADWKRLGEVCWELVACSLRQCGFSAAAVDQYLIRAGAVEFGRTHGRSAVGCMNRMIDALAWMQCDHDAQFQAYLTHYLNVDDVGSCATRKGLGCAAERMAEDLLEIGINPHGGTQYAIDYARLHEGDADGPEGDASRRHADFELPDDAKEDVKRDTGANSPSESELMRELDEIIAALDTEEDQAELEIISEIETITRAMRAERGNDPDRPPKAEGLCTVCGADPRVFLDRVPYCLNCHNELTERLMGTQHITNDSSTLAVFDAGGALVQFAVERMVTPPFARWTAHELVDDNEYVGVEVCVDADPDEDQDITLARLWEKAQQAISRPSTHVHAHPAHLSGWVSNGAHMGGEILFAEDSGWGRIDEDEHGRCSVIVDGRRYGAEEFLGLFSGHVGFDLHWQIHDPSDDLPNH